MIQHTVVCPGCGVQLVTDNDAMDNGFNAAAACRELDYELAYYTLSLQDSYFIHQLAVDAYAAQHSGNQVKPITTAFALVGLFLVNERNFTGRQVQRAHMALALKSKVWPGFDAPKEKVWLTVKDVVQTPDDQKQEMIKKWSGSVWDVWRGEKEQVAALLKKDLDI